MSTLIFSFILSCWVQVLAEVNPELVYICRFGGSFMGREGPLSSESFQEFSYTKVHILFLYVLLRWLGSQGKTREFSQG